MESNYKIYPYQLYKEKDGLITVTVNDELPPIQIQGENEYNLPYCKKLKKWESLCLNFPIDTKEAYEVKDDIRSWKHLGKLAGQDWVETIQKGVQVSCIAIVDGKAIFHNPDNNEENINQSLLTIDEILIKNGITNLTGKMHDQFIASINEYYVMHSSEYKKEISKLKEEVDKWKGIAYVDGVNSDLKSEKINRLNKEIEVLLSAETSEIEMMISLKAKNDKLTQELQQYKDIYESRSLKTHYKKIKHKTLALSEIYGFKEPYEGSNWIHSIRNIITWSDFTTVTKWLFDNGYDIIKPNK